MLRVTVLVNVNGEMVEKEIVMDNSGRMTPSDPKDGLLKYVITHPYFLESRNRKGFIKFDPEIDPFNFFENLYRAYNRGMLVKVGRAKRCEVRSF